MAKSRAEIIRDATLKARADWVNYVELQNKALYDLYQRYADQLARELAKSQYQGKIPPGAQARLNKVVKDSIPGFRKSIAGSIQRGISRSVDYAFMSQILALDAGGIAQRMIQLGSSFIGKDGKVIRWNAAKETFLQSTWGRMNKTAVDAVMAWKPGGLAFSDRVWDITYQSQKQMLKIIQQGVMDGRSAAELSRDLRKYLVQPETLRGKVLKDLKPGQGVYKSAYKNAMRLARTELNRAFAEGTYRYAQQKTWIDGYIWRRGGVGKCSSGECPNNADEFFPKDTPPEIPAHPHCLCYPELHIAGDPMPADGEPPEPPESPGSLPELTKEDKEAISNWSGLGYHMINTGEVYPKEALPMELKMRDAFYAAMNKLPDKQGTLYRGMVMSEDKVEITRLWGRMNLRHATACSADKDIAAEFATRALEADPNFTRVIMKIEAKTSKDISTWANPREKEHILMKGKKLKVNGILEMKDADGKYYLLKAQEV